MKFFLPLLLLILIFSCISKEPSVPGDIIPVEKMAVILADIHLAQAGVNFPAKRDTIIRAANYSMVFHIHSTDTAQVEKSLTFYKQHPVLMNRIYDRVIEELSRIQAESAK